MSNFLRFLRKQRIDWIKTLIVNFKCLPYKQAKHLPIYIYSDTIVASYGNIVIKSDDIKPGMIKIGKRNFFIGHKTQLINAGTLSFNGRALIEAGTCINNSCGVLDIGSDVRLGEMCKILQMKNIRIGDYTRIAFGTILTDSDYHNVIDTKTKVVRKACLPIIIGKYNWIGNNSSITKGTVTPDYAIVTAKSLCNKDYSQYPLYSVFAGAPAKWLAEGKRRVFNSKSCQTISGLFAKDESLTSVVMPDDIADWDAFCLGGDEILFSEG